MKLLGIPLRKPSFNEFTAASIMGVGLWMLALGLMRASKVEVAWQDAGALLIMALWGCLCARLGIRVGAGGRHLLANLLVGATLLGCYQAALAFMA